MESGCIQADMNDVLSGDAVDIKLESDVTIKCIFKGYLAQQIHSKVKG